MSYTGRQYKKANVEIANIILIKPQEDSYLVNTWKILDSEAKKNPSNHPATHFQNTSDEVGPDGTCNHQQEKDFQLLEYN